MVHRFFNRVIVQSPLVLALGGASMTWRHVIHFNLSPLYCVESFLLVWLGYRYFQTRSNDLFSFERHFALTATLILFLIHDFPLSTVASGCLLIFYNWPKQFALRTIPGAKNISIALAWTGCTTALVIHPTTQGGIPLFADSLLIFALSIWSDLRDQKRDEQKIKTLAHLLGQNACLFIAGICLMIYPLLSNLHLPSTLFMIAIAVVLVFVLCSKKIITLSPPISTLWIDGATIWMPLLVAWCS